jgi:hypothetical protein
MYTRRRGGPKGKKSQVGILKQVIFSFQLYDMSAG